MNILKKFFTAHFEDIQYILHLRHVVMEYIEMMFTCRNPSYGSAMYGRLIVLTIKLRLLDIDFAMSFLFHLFSLHSDISAKPEKCR